MEASEALEILQQSRSLPEAFKDLSKESVDEVRGIVAKVAIELADPRNRSALEQIARAVISDAMLHEPDAADRVKAAKAVLESLKGEANVTNFTNIFAQNVVADVA